MASEISITTWVQHKVWFESECVVVDIQGVRKVTVHSYIYYNAVCIAFVSIDAKYGFHYHQGTIGPFFKLVNLK